MEVYPNKSFLSLPDFSESLVLLVLASLALLAMEKVTLLTVLVGLIAFAFGEALYETFCHLNLVNEWGLWFTWKVGAVTCMVRTISEFGRFYGQFERGTLLFKLFHRYNWFEENWPEWPTVERTRAVKRTLFRTSVAGASVAAAHALAAAVCS
jgi:hypothetical protein